MLVLGLTGGISTGKSTVSGLLKARHIPVIDADILAREAVAPGSPGLSKIITVFGPDILLADGSLDRKKLGDIIFNDPAKRKVLNGIVHPAVRRSMLWGVIKYWIKGEPLCILDVPLLIEGGLDRLVGRVAVVYCPSDIQLARLQTRDSSTEEAASARINSQMSIEDKAAVADYVVDNSGSMSELEQKVDHLVSSLRRDAGWTWRLSWILPPYGLLSALLVLVSRYTRRRKLAK
ncbi:CoaE-domain-containing protein [Flagelloscypha sp. PMI_526]|nr:CoaE-domain-containing protein [Flagelloscypha sp. PMI_526]